MIEVEKSLFLFSFQKCCSFESFSLAIYCETLGLFLISAITVLFDVSFCLVQISFLFSWDDTKSIICTTLLSTHVSYNSPLTLYYKDQPINAMHCRISCWMPVEGGVTSTIPCPSNIKGIAYDTSSKIFNILLK